MKRGHQSSTYLLSTLAIAASLLHLHAGVAATGSGYPLGVYQHYVELDVLSNSHFSTSGLVTYKSIVGAAIEQDPDPCDVVGTQVMGVTIGADAIHFQFQPRVRDSVEVELGGDDDLVVTLTTAGTDPATGMVKALTGQLLSEQVSVNTTTKDGVMTGSAKISVKAEVFTGSLELVVLSQVDKYDLTNEYSMGEEAEVEVTFDTSTHAISVSFDFDVYLNLTSMLARDDVTGYVTVQGTTGAEGYMPICNASVAACPACGGSDVQACCSGNGRYSLDTCICDEGYCGPLCADEKDLCGVCGGDGTSCCSSHGVMEESGCNCTAPYCGSNCSAVHDNCGVCDGDSTSCCAGHGVKPASGPCQCNGEYCGDSCSQVYDNCGVCGGDSMSCCDSHGVMNASKVCHCSAGYCGSTCTNAIDGCGVCAGNGRSCCANAGVMQSGVCKCDEGKCGSTCTEVKDECGVCGGNGESCCSNRGDMTAAGVCECKTGYCGSVCKDEKDNCGVCNGDNTYCCSARGVKVSASLPCVCNAGYFGDACSFAHNNVIELTLNIDVEDVTAEMKTKIVADIARTLHILPSRVVILKVEEGSAVVYVGITDDASDTNYQSGAAATSALYADATANNAQHYIVPNAIAIATVNASGIQQDTAVLEPTPPANGGAIAGAIFGTIAAAGVVALVVFMVMKRKKTSKRYMRGGDDDVEYVRSP